FFCNLLPAASLTAFRSQSLAPIARRIKNKCRHSAVDRACNVDAAQKSFRELRRYRCGLGLDRRIVIEDRRQPFMRLVEGPALALGIILNLVAADLADAEIMAVGMAEIEPAH